LVEIEYTPLKKIIIHDIELVPIKRFIEHSVSRGGTIGWCDGYLFTLQHFPPDPDLIKDAVKGIIHWQNIEVAHYEKFSPTVKSTDNRGIEVMDQSHVESITDAMKKVKEILKID